MLKYLTISSCLFFSINVFADSYSVDFYAPGVGERESGINFRMADAKMGCGRTVYVWNCSFSYSEGYTGKEISEKIKFYKSDGSYCEYKIDAILDERYIDMGYYDYKITNVNLLSKTMNCDDTPRIDGAYHINY